MFLEKNRVNLLLYINFERCLLPLLFIVAVLQISPIFTYGAANFFPPFSEKENVKTLVGDKK